MKRIGKREAIELFVKNKVVLSYAYHRKFFALIEYKRNGDFVGCVTLDVATMLRELSTHHEDFGNTQYWFYKNKNKNK